jgi:16S rRNA (guanine966-N2)-methyltransferase
MRIISGKYKGRKLISPQNGSIRPTSDKVRESIFNILEHKFGVDFTNARVCDVFAGSGAIGIEAISRGAQLVHFIEQSKDAIDLIHQNGKSLAIDITSFRMDATQPNKANQPYSMIFMDPPYDKGLATKAINSMLDNSWIANNALIVIEELIKVELKLPTEFTFLDKRAYGKTAVSFYQFMND